MFRLLWRSALPCFPSPASTRNMLLTCSWQVLRALLSRAIWVVSPFRFHYERAHFKSWGCPPRKKTFLGPKSPLPAAVMWHKPDRKGLAWATFWLLKKWQIKISLGSGVPPFWERPKRKVFFLGGLPIGGFRIPWINPFPRVAKETAPSCSVRPSLTLEFVAHLTLSLT